MRTLEEWQRKAAQGTSGDMVWDILMDWEQDKLNWSERPISKGSYVPPAKAIKPPKKDYMPLGQGMCADDRPPPRADLPNGF